MFCCPHCSQLSTILNNIVTPDAGSTILLTSVNNVGSKTLFNPIEQWARRFLPCRVREREREKERCVRDSGIGSEI